MPFRRLADVVAEVAELAERFVAADRKLYLVGGIVRDLWLDGELPAEADIDLTTDALPEETRRIVDGWADALWLQGERFGTIGARHQGRSYEITTHRAESYTSDSRKPEVVFGDDIDTDLSRRDFTVNAMAIELPAGELVDPYGGADDLGARVLRTPLDADISFTDDPLRILRAARFMTRYDLEPVAELNDAATRLSGRIDIVSIERVRDELEKLFGAASIDRGIGFLASTGVLGKALPSLAPTLDAGMRLAAQAPAPWWLRLAGLVRPQWEGDPDAAIDTLRSLRCSRETIGQIKRVLRAVDVVAEANEIDDELVRRFVDVATPYTDDAFELAQVCEVAGDLGECWRELASREDLSSFDAPIDGPVVIELLGVEPGPVIGEALAVVREERLRSGPLTEVQARTIVETWWADRAG